jgi:hypothetical protein
MNAQSQTNFDDGLEPAKVTAQEIGVTRRTLHTWVNDPEMGFPAPITINGRWYFSKAKIRGWKEERFRMSLSQPRPGRKVGGT